MEKTKTHKCALLGDVGACAFACAFAMVLLEFPPFSPSVSFYEIKCLREDWNVE